MSVDVQIGGGGKFVAGDKVTLTFEVLNGPADEPASIPVDVTGFTTETVFRTSDKATAALLTKSGSVTGIFDATRSVNTQRVSVVLTKANTLLFTGNAYRYATKRTDVGNEVTMGHGRVVVDHLAAEDS